MTMTALPATDDDETQEILRAHRKFWQSTLAIRLYQLSLIVLAITAWGVLAGKPGDRFVIIDEFYVGNPSQAWQAIKDRIADGTLWSSTAATLTETLIGFSIGCLSGMIVGFLLAVSPTVVSRTLNPFVTAAYSIPKLALGPLFLLWFGLGTMSKVALVSLVVFFLVFFNTYSGVREVDRDLLNVLRVMGASRLTLHRRVTIPSAASWVIAGLHISVPYAFVAAVVGEMIASYEGLGYLIRQASSSFNPSAMFAYIGVLVIMALILNGGVSLLERATQKWQRAGRGSDLGAGIL